MTGQWKDFYKGFYIKWVPFSVAGQRLDHYRILLNNGAKQITEYQENLEFTELKVINLTECSTYNINVQTCVGTGCTDYLSARAEPYMQVPPTPPPPHVIAWSKTEHVVYWSDEFGLPTQCSLGYRLRIIINDGKPKDMTFMHCGPHRIGPIESNAYYTYSIQLQMDVTVTGSWSEQETITTPTEPTYPIKLDIQNSNFGEQKITWIFTETQYRHESSNRYYLVITWLGGRQNVTVTYNQPFIRTDLKQNVEYTYILYAYMKTDVLISNVIVISTLPIPSTPTSPLGSFTPEKTGIRLQWTQPSGIYSQCRVQYDVIYKGECEATRKLTSTTRQLMISQVTTTKYYGYRVRMTVANSISSAYSRQYVVSAT
ncbi:hypothetical protein PHET_05280 [Paragonimus heterotremus]|uniref:Fibronectin type-III domain-containing protein n=1 Tax=Paragonimus heterotremus TaxID=100268 RepID=A0A8J4SPU1_9TREM|nr:hypothetical protein PHET_05280 [Paragonimus heterotremus]